MYCLEDWNVSFYCISGKKIQIQVYFIVSQIRYSISDTLLKMYLNTRYKIIFCVLDTCICKLVFQVLPSTAFIVCYERPGRDDVGAGEGEWGEVAPPLNFGFV